MKNSKRPSEWLYSFLQQLSHFQGTFIPIWDPQGDMEIFMCEARNSFKRNDI